MKFKIILLFHILRSLNVFATSQEPDKIKINGIEYPLLNNPLEYNKIISEKLYNLGTSKDGERTLSTGNYRGYIATYEIRNSELYLIDVVIPDPNENFEKKISVLNKIFPEQDRIRIKYSGILIIPIGDFLDSANFGYSYLFSEYKLITIKNDKVEKSKNINKDDYLKFKVIQFVEYKKTDDYKNALKENFDNWKIEKKIELSRKNTKNLTKKEIAELQKDYANPPTVEYVDNFFFLTKNFDFVIVDY